MLLAATLSNLKKVLASDDSLLRRIYVLVFNESLEHMLVRFLNFFRSDFRQRSVKEMQRQLIVKGASDKYGLTVFLLSLVCEALEPSLKMALHLGERLLNAVENYFSLFSIVVAMVPCSDIAFSSQKVDLFSNHTLRTLAGASESSPGIADAIALAPAKEETNSGVMRFDNSPLSCVQVFCFGKKC